MSTIALEPQVSATPNLRTLYVTRAVFAFGWAASLFLTAPRAPAVAGVLMVLYPAWDAGITALDLRRGAAEGRTLQWTNFAFSTLTALAIAFSGNVTQVITAFAAWAIIAGVLQLAVGISRRRTLGGQWAMIVSGAQSTLAGASFVAMAHAPDASVQKLAPYAVFGGFYFALSAFRQWRATKA